MTKWQLTKGLENLRSQVNAAFPDRATASDGTIGDEAHMAEVSGHNPDDTAGSKAEYNDHDGIPEVRAWDMTSTLNAPPATAQQVVDHIRKLPGVSSVLRYMIYNRKIYEASNGWNSRAYTGASAHTEHIHFSGARTQAADNNTTFNYRLEEIPVSLTAADKVWLADRIDAAVKLGKQSDGTPTSPAGNAILSQGIPNGTRTGGPRDAAWKVIEDLGAALVRIEGKVDDLAATGKP